MIKIYGSGDDCLEIEGDVDEEFCLYGEGPSGFLACSDGTLLKIEYTEGVWLINRLVPGTAEMTRTENAGPDGDYTDRVRLDGDIKWVIFSYQDEFVARKK